VEHGIVFPRILRNRKEPFVERIKDVLVVGLDQVLVDLLQKVLVPGFNHVLADYIQNHERTPP
jgi:hypothetical protein